ncbi:MULTISPECIES: helix-hairpin-helix domain-containing protein [unclassified Bacillus (in: firmicutes)]|uniref:helix-hairpin-helix domain-containing protein n=1 Tax=unclassified Bacillus (in: firmicutes) TaxID=185979 RepID=UPI0008F0F552|nr:MULTISPECIES: helix-hairpin-helix domain-containing protein [unclassified Bacillus (in: firmicutes)]SFB20882.1 Helix-hairpin-helix domain-containing protein [Bacillus sp. UNCCL13]SFQ90923.1 Helix-hairpin-helix domain-containing protein [Bacillus sp. cl95]
MSHNERVKGIDLPTGLAKPALRALHGAGIFTLEQFTDHAEADIMQLHGMGPKAMERIRLSLTEKGLSFRKS